MRVLSLRELRERGVDPSHGAALVAGVADVVAARRQRGEPIAIPEDDHIVLDQRGHLHFTRVTPADAATGDVAALATLLSRLLGLDSNSRRSVVPGALMVLIARALGEIDLPAPSLHTFREALLRVAPDPASLRAGLARQVFGPPAVRPALPPPALTSVTPRPVVAKASWVRPSMAFAAGALLTMLAGFVFEPASTPRRAPASAAARPAQVHTRPATAPVTATTAHPSPAARRHAAVRLLLSDIGGAEPFSPTFAADGSSIYFHTGRSNGQLMRASMAADGTVARVTPLLHDRASNFHVVPSPDGSRLAFDSDREGVRAVFVSDSEGMNVRRISGPGFAAVPSWSPDGRSLAFVKADSNPRTWNVWVADLRNGALRQVSHHRVGQAWGASWFPDGRRLAYSCEQRLVIVDLRTGKSTVVSTPRAGHLVRTPAVSPDGTRVVFQVRDDGVWMFDLTRGRISRVLADRSAEEFRWSPDGERIAYHARHGSRWGVWTLEATS